MATDDDLRFDVNLNIDPILHEFEGFDEALAVYLNRAMNEALAYTEAQIVLRTPKYDGALQSSIQGHNVSSPPNFQGIITTPLVYGIVIERGRKPGSRMPPLDVIQLWVSRVLNPPEEEIESVAWAVAKHIAKYGFSDAPEAQVGSKGARMFEEGLKASEAQINLSFENAVNRALGDMLGWS